MLEKVPTEIKPLLTDFLVEINHALPNLLNGFQLYGSIALGNFHPEKSDIDFLAIINRPCSEKDISTLGAIHQSIANRYPKHPMEGCYLQKSDLGKENHALNAYPYFDGKMHHAGHYDINLVTWWILKNHGITLYGDDIRSQDFDVSWDTLKTAIHENLNSYWHEWAYEPKFFAYLLKDAAIEWAILGVLRLYYSFQKNSITSKTSAGKYALLQLPQKWHPLIQHAIALRNGQLTSYKNRVIRQQEAQHFLQFVIRECNQILG